MRFRFRDVLVALVLTSTALRAADKPTAETIVQKSLDAIGTPDARAKMNARALDGISGIREVLGGFGSMQGTAALATRNNDFRLRMTFDRPDYKGEDISVVNDKVTVGVISPGVRSFLGGFLVYFPELLTEGLFGGELSTAWPLANLEARGAKLKMRGNKKIDGKNLTEVQYFPRKGNSDLQIFLYFDAEAGQHVMSRYEAPYQGYSNPNGSMGVTSPNSSDNKTVLEERFSDYGAVGQIKLPLRWKIRLTGSQGRETDYEAVFRTMHPTVSDAAFDVK